MRQLVILSSSSCISCFFMWCGFDLLGSAGHISSAFSSVINTSLILRLSSFIPLSLCQSFFPSFIFHFHAMYAIVSAVHLVSLSFFPFQSLWARNLRVYAGPCVVFLAATENLLLQHHIPNQHTRPRWCFPDGTLQFCGGRWNAAQFSLRRWGGILHRATADPRRSDLTAPCLIWTPGLLFDGRDETDPLRDITSIHGQDRCVCHTWASHQAFKNIAILEICGI